MFKHACESLSLNSLALGGDFAAGRRLFFNITEHKGATVVIQSLYTEPASVKRYQDLYKKYLDIGELLSNTLRAL